MMRGRERLLATGVIWIVSAIMLNMILTAFTRLNADFTGLWPNLGMVNWSDTAAVQRWEQAMQAAQSLSSQLMEQVTATMARQFSGQLAPMIVTLAMVVLLAAALSTLFVWRGAAEAEAPAQAGKTKREPGRVGQVLATLSDDEV